MKRCYNFVKFLFNPLRDKTIKTCRNNFTLNNIFFNDKDIIKTGKQVILSFSTFNAIPYIMKLIFFFLFKILETIIDKYKYNL